VGAYLIEGQVGQGGMGVVYRARDTNLGRLVALKVIRAGADDGPGADAVARFLREAKLGASLAHPNIVVVYEAGAFGDVPYLAMEWVDGRPLAALIDSPTVTLAQRLDLLDAIADALAYAHERGIIHRDVKPSNVMVDDRGRARLVDFGIAKRTAQFVPGTMMLPTHARQVLGTPAYMAPEQMLSAAVDARADQFSWAVMAYELLSTKHPNETVPEDGPPFPVAKAQPLAWLRSEVPEILAAVIHRAMSYEPGGRFSSMTELTANWRGARSNPSAVTSSGSYGSLPPNVTASTNSTANASTPYARHYAPTQGSLGGPPLHHPSYGPPPTAPTLGMTGAGVMGPPPYGPSPYGHALAPAPAPRRFPWLAVIAICGCLLIASAVGVGVLLTVGGAGTGGGGSGPGLPALSPALSVGPEKAALESFDDLKFAPPAPDVAKTKAAVEAKLTPCFDSRVSKEQSFKATITVVADGRVTKVTELEVCKEQHPSFYLCTERGKIPKKGFPTVPDEVFACLDRALASTRLPRIVLAPGETSMEADLHIEVK